MKSILKTYRPFIIGVLSLILSCLIYTKFLMPNIPEHKTDASINWEVIKALHDAKVDRIADMSTNT
jgi:hypothetical protein